MSMMASTIVEFLFSKFLLLSPPGLLPSVLKDPEFSNFLRNSPKHRIFMPGHPVQVSVGPAGLGVLGAQRAAFRDEQISIVQKRQSREFVFISQRVPGTYTPNNHVESAD